jgi:hypothetical protein
MPIFARNTLSQAAVYISKELCEPYQVDDVESLIKEGKLIACVDKGGFLKYLFSGHDGGYNSIKNGRSLLVADTKEDLANGPETNLGYVGSEEIQLHNVVVLKEEIDEFLATRIAGPSHKTISNTETWTLRKPMRDQGYNTPLYDFLKAAHDAGKSRPTAAEILQAWRDCPPLGFGIKVADNQRSMTYDGGGKRPVRCADAEAITKSIRYYTKLNTDS